MLVEKPEKLTIPSDNEEFGMSNVDRPKKFKPNEVKEDEELNNVVKIN